MLPVNIGMWPVAGCAVGGWGGSAVRQRIKQHHHTLTHNTHIPSLQKHLLQLLIYFLELKFIIKSTIKLNNSTKECNGGFIHKHKA